MSCSKLLDPSKPAADKPLGLTVHAMPQPGQAMASRRRGRWTMMAVLLACAAPVVASYLTYYVIRPETRRVYGELIDPQRPLPSTQALRLDGQSLPLSSLKGQWLLVSVCGGACDATCAEHLYLQRQLREGLGKDKDRMDWVWLVADDAAVPDTLQAALKGATVLRVPPADLASWLTPASGQVLAQHLYVVDPIGNWMMRFPAGLDRSTASRAKRDLERLLRASAFWDQAGRETGK